MRRSDFMFYFSVGFLAVVLILEMLQFLRVI